ncbi:hypothetical protein GGTG_03414 [Gaeumannomyces tritici R3-111a-1]|uniref:Uncharacterized protein n=1 Tax=Gaeumannomyces tritici (strain R3-111a-1) TaxID=644352 RepID=J3NQ57_GAET3|nr:hypothetical protein GGTG_03414 [Gaeumannomyces tritici R3-111a-1]EJT78313.1 hypothetical protein GGTG_03414 [Gaeumannomyces tritici R3-111a-1]
MPSSSSRRDVHQITTTDRHYRCRPRPTRFQGPVYGQYWLPRRQAATKHDGTRDSQPLRKPLRVRRLLPGELGARAERDAPRGGSSAVLFLCQHTLKLVLDDSALDLDEDPCAPASLGRESHATLGDPRVGGADGSGAGVESRPSV